MDFYHITDCITTTISTINTKTITGTSATSSFSSSSATSGGSFKLRFGAGRLMDTWILFLFVIVAGTKWCGSGNIAMDYDDLGRFAETDACCREHDYCDDIIEAMMTKHNLTNPSIYTRLHCSCDEKFYDCLQRSGDKIAGKIGFLYFNVLDTKCFREDYPIVNCKRYANYPRRCLEYELDESQTKRYQWFDVPLYAKTTMFHDINDVNPIEFAHSHN